MCIQSASVVKAVRMTHDIHIIGGGLAGSEAACLFMAAHGIEVFENECLIFLKLIHGLLLYVCSYAQLFH